MALLKPLEQRRRLQHPVAIRTEQRLDLARPHLGERVDGVPPDLGHLRERNPDAIEVVLFASVVHLAESEGAAAQAAEGMAQMFDAEAAQVRAHPMTLIGTSAQIAATLEERREQWGIDSLMLGGPSPETLETFGKEVLPRINPT